MPGTRNDFGQMYDNELNPRKGWAGDRGMALEKVLEIDDASNTISAGQVVTIGANNTFLRDVTGTPSTTLARPPLFAFPNENDFDVNPDLGNIAGGTLMALSCLGDFELESTAVAASQTFVPGSYLRPDGNGDLAAGTLGTHLICGIVCETGSNTDGTFENEHGQNVVRFWTCFFPAQLTAS